MQSPAHALVDPSPISGREPRSERPLESFLGGAYRDSRHSSEQDISASSRQPFRWGVIRDLGAESLGVQDFRCQPPYSIVSGGNIFQPQAEKPTLT